ncbi:uncharacterized protein LOC117133397 [Brassica rapa]|uniref:uncharacterized protein LOC117133397 n=1 Tax=Brassica campestris TaxID=3711 RepID=UPI00142E8248|nr:uncharacterized protein LOC117133397 [Brassica rapa]
MRYRKERIIKSGDLEHVLSKEPLRDLIGVLNFFSSGGRFATRIKKIQGGGETASKTTTAKLELDDEGELLSQCNMDGGLKRRKLVDSDDSGGLTPWRKLSRFRAERRWGIAERCGGLEW